MILLFCLFGPKEALQFLAKPELKHPNRCSKKENDKRNNKTRNLHLIVLNRGWALLCMMLVYLFLLLLMRYTPRPLVVQGPGAGAAVTAAGIFGNVMEAMVTLAWHSRRHSLLNSDARCLCVCVCVGVVEAEISHANPPFFLSRLSYVEM